MERLRIFMHPWEFYASENVGNAYNMQKYIKYSM